ncbi:TetR family transcriptional regulator [Roseomonas gilardii subsp. gilardii]|uniref:TetR family transcriptional regulator n=1 Tax=Roseomonas gilardii TaxID=257708 RepID=UPI001FFA7EBF|nr:TetR family transcriptional regulator [Roseomonas gilardii]UPG72473.1 TetR family transcriptional regulator [Roseomonas gilardii subsp. gilardii]
MARHTKAQAEQTREAILDAAEKVFYERGVARSTLEEVARVAGVTRGAIYWHFRDKLDLFLTLNERAELPHEDLVARLAENPELDPLEELDTIMATTKRQFEQDERRRRLLTIFYQRCEYVDEMAPALHRLQRADEELRAKFRELLHLAATRYPLAPLDPGHRRRRPLRTDPGHDAALAARAPGLPPERGRAASGAGLAGLLPSQIPENRQKS